MRTITMLELRKEPGELIRAVARHGESFTITKSARPVARLVPIAGPEDERAVDVLVQVRALLSVGELEVLALRKVAEAAASEEVDERDVEEGLHACRLCDKDFTIRDDGSSAVGALCDPCAQEAAAALGEAVLELLKQIDGARALLVPSSPSSRDEVGAVA